MTYPHDPLPPTPPRRRDDRDSEAMFTAIIAAVAVGIFVIFGALIFAYSDRSMPPTASKNPPSTIGQSQTPPAEQSRPNPAPPAQQ